MMNSIDAGSLQAAMMAPKPYIWPCWWGGIASSDKPPMIHDKIQALRMAVGGIEAKKQAGGPMFPVRGAKELNQKLAQALNDLDLVAPQVAQEHTHFETGDGKIPGNATNSGKPVFRTLTHCKATVRLGASDGSFVDFVGSGHGGDTDDKAGGKSSTYAWKDAVFKGLTVPHADMVDTDDEQSESSDGPGVGESKRGRKAKAPAADAGDKPAAGPDGDTKAVAEIESPKDLAFIEAAIRKAGTLEELEGIAANIKSGIFKVAGADRLKASTAYVARKRELTPAA
jgi:hypothetical protein